MIRKPLECLLFFVATCATVTPWIGGSANESTERVARQTWNPQSVPTAGVQDPASGLRSLNISYLKNLKSVGVAVNVWSQREWQDKTSDQVVEVLTSTASKELDACGIKVVAESNKFKTAFKAEAMLTFEVSVPDTGSEVASLRVSLLEPTTLRRNGATVLSETWTYNFSVYPLYSLRRNVQTFPELVRAASDASAGFANDYSQANGYRHKTAMPRR